MAYMTFAQVQAEFRSDDGIQKFRCMACTPQCERDYPLEPGRKRIAKHLVLSQRNTLSRGDVIDIINLLLCAEHQEGYVQKNGIRARWAREFPGMDITSSGGYYRSPYTLHNSKYRRYPAGTPTRPSIGLLTPPDSRENLRETAPVIAPMFVFGRTPPAQPNFTVSSSAPVASSNPFAEPHDGDSDAESSRSGVRGNSGFWRGGDEELPHSRLFAPITPNPEPSPPLEVNSRNDDPRGSSSPAPEPESPLALRNSRTAEQGSSTDSLDRGNVPDGATDRASFNILDMPFSDQDESDPADSDYEYESESTEEELEYTEGGDYSEDELDYDEPDLEFDEMSEDGGNHNDEHAFDGADHEHGADIVAHAAPLDEDNPLAIAEDAFASQADVEDVHTGGGHLGAHGDQTQQSETSTDVSEPVTEVFRPGDASTWSPWTLRSEVLDLLFDPLPNRKAKGSIYVVQVSTADKRPMVKIGYTTRPVRTRMQEIAAQHGQLINLDSRFHISHIPILQLQRLEKLVHSDLAFFQRDLRIRHGRVHRTHREYFAVDLVTAERTIKFWYDVIKDIGLEPGKDLDEDVIASVRAHPALAVERADVDATADEPETWTRLNSNHGRRENIWTTVFQRDRGGFKRSRDDERSWWFLTIIFLLAMPSVFGGEASLAYTLVVISFGAMKCLRLL